jgi:predicted glycosyltransferase
MVGIPTISVYQDDLLEVDKLLISTKKMLHKKKLILGDIEESINYFNAEPQINDLMFKGKHAYHMLMNEITH